MAELVTACAVGWDDAARFDESARSTVCCGLKDDEPSFFNVRKSFVPSCFNAANSFVLRVVAFNSLTATGSSPGFCSFRRTTVSSGSFCARISASASSAPSSRHQSSATQSGYECLSAASGGVASGSESSSSRSPSVSLRRTAFVNETARSSPAARTSSTDSFTAACTATSEKPSW